MAPIRDDKPLLDVMVRGAKSRDFGSCGLSGLSGHGGQSGRGPAGSRPLCPPCPLSPQPPKPGVLPLLRISTRYEKTALSFLSMLWLIGAIIGLR